MTTPGKTRWWWIVVPAVVAVGLLAAGFVVSIGRWRITDDAMAPTFTAPGAVWGRRRAYPNVAAIHRGDLVVARLPNGERVARVMGLPGDRIAIRADRLMLNGRELAIRILRTAGPLTIFEEVVDGNPHEIALSQHPVGEAAPLQFGERTVPDGHLFLVADNRRLWEGDSRRFGPVAFADILAVVRR